MEIESGFPSILESKREGEDDYSMGGGGVLVFLFDKLLQLTNVSPKIQQFEKKLRKAKLCKKGVEGRVVTQLVTLRGKLRPSTRLGCRTVINVDLVRQKFLI